MKISFEMTFFSLEVWTHNPFNCIPQSDIIHNFFCISFNYAITEALLNDMFTDLMLLGDWETDFIIKMLNIIQQRPKYLGF